MTDAYHRGNLQLSQVGSFAYVAPSVPDDYVIIICIDLVLPMGQLESIKCFCTFSETLTNISNVLVYKDFPVPAYGAISTLLATEPGPPHILKSLTHIECYMNDVISAVQEGGRATTPSL